MAQTHELSTVVPDEIGRSYILNTQGIDHEAAYSLSGMKKGILYCFSEVIINTPPPYVHSRKELETESPIGEEERQKLVEFMLKDPYGKELFGTSPDLSYIRKNAATHRALERLYTGPLNISDIWARIFIDGIHNSMAVRNRFRLVQQELDRFVVAKIDHKEEPIHILSIAAGSSRAIMEKVHELNGSATDIRMKLVDLSRNALSDARTLATELEMKASERLNIGMPVELIRSHFGKSERYLTPGYNPDFVEIVGLFDYVEAKDIVRLLEKLKEVLAENGVIIYSNIAPNPEEKFTQEIVEWPKMHYRTEEEIFEFAIKAGFDAENIELTKEPLGVYNLARLRK